MPDYKELYLTLFRETTKAISILQKAQQTTEESYISEELFPDDRIILLNTDEINENKQ